MGVIVSNILQAKEGFNLLMSVFFLKVTATEKSVIFS